MKRIPLKVLVDVDNKDDVIDYRAVIKAIVRKPLDSQRGVDIEEMRRGIRILDALDAAKGTILDLDDADHAHLIEKLQAMQWVAVDRRIMQFIDDVTNPPDEASLNHVWTAAAVEVG